MNHQRPVFERRGTLYPTIRTNKIHIRQGPDASLRIQIDYSLNIVRTGFDPSETGRDALSDFLRSREGMETAKITFMVLDERNESLIPDLMNYDRQSQTIVNQVNDDRFTLLGLTGGKQSILLRDALLQSAESEIYTPTLDMGGETFYETYNTTEIVYTVADLEPNLQGRSIFSPYYDEEGYEIEGNFNFAATYLNALHLVAFIEMPYEQFTQNPETVPEGLMSIPITETIYDKLLESSTRGSLRPPTTRNIFYVNDSSSEFSEINQRPYSGPAHYHVNSEVQGDDNYTGWMAGINHDDAGPKLAVRTVPNLKVSVDAAPIVDFSNLSIIGQSQAFHAETGQELERYLQNLDNSSMSNFLNPYSMTRTLIDESINALSANKRSFIEPWSYTHKWITRSADPEVLDNSYNCIFGIKYFDLIKNNTALGSILSLHYSIGPIPEKSMKIISDILKASKILNMKVIRRRLSYDPYSNNDQDTKMYTDFQENQQNDFILEVSDVINNNSFREENTIQLAPIQLETAAASIEEVLLRLDGDTIENTITDNSAQEIQDGTLILDDRLLTRSFLLRDYELFYNIDCGKYTYDLQIYFQDAVKSFVDGSVMNILRYFIRMKEDFQEFNGALVGPATIDGTQEGNYDFSRRRFVNVAPELAERFTSSLHGLLQACNYAIYLVSKKTPFSGDRDDVESVMAQTILRCDPRRPTTRIEDIEFIIDQVQELVYAFNDMLQRVFLVNNNTMPNYSKKVNVSSTSATNSSIIYVPIKTGIIHDSEDTQKLMSNFNLPFDSFDQFIDRARFEENARILREQAEREERARRERERSLEPRPTNENDRPVFEDPYGIDFDTEIELDFNLEYMEPIEFINFEKIRIRVDFEDKLARYQELIQDRLGPIPDPRVRERQAQNLPEKINILEPYANDGLVVKITKGDFYTSNLAEKSVKENKILVLMQKDSHLSGLEFKDSSYDAREISNSIGGVETKFAGKTLANQVESAASFAVATLIPDTTALSRETKIAITDTLIDSNTKDEFVKRMELNYKELSETRELLGKAYTMFNRINAYSTASLRISSFKKDPETEYKFGLKKDTSKAFNDFNKDPFQAKQSLFVTYDIHGNSTRHKKNIMSKMKQFCNRTQAQIGSNIRSVKLFKLETVRDQDNIPGLNNAMLLERK